LLTVFARVLIGVVIFYGPDLNVSVYDRTVTLSRRAPELCAVRHCMAAEPSHRWFGGARVIKTTLRFMVRQ